MSTELSPNQAPTNNSLKEIFNLRCGISGTIPDIQQVIRNSIETLSAPLKPCNSKFHSPTAFATLPLASYKAFVPWRPTIKLKKDGTIKIAKVPLAGQDWPNQLETYPDILNRLQAALAKRPTSFANLDPTFEHPLLVEELLSHGFKPSPLVGVGFAYTDQHPFICVDLDDLTDDNLAIAQALNSYTEVSPSGHGYHVIVAMPSTQAKADLVTRYLGLNKRNAQAQRDLYVNTGFVTLTHDLVPEYPSEIATITPTLAKQILEQYFKVAKSSTPAPQVTKTAPPEATSATPPTKAKRQSLIKLNQVQIKTMLDALPCRLLSDDMLDTMAANLPIRINRADDAPEPEGRNIWLMVGAAVHSWSKGSFDGYHLFNTWSAQGNKYEESACQAVWTSFDENTTGGITVATLVKLYQLSSYSFPNRSAKGTAVANDYENFKAVMHYLGIKPKLNIYTREVSFDMPEDTRASMARFEGPDDIGVDSFAECLRSEMARIMFNTPPFSSDFLARALVQMSLSNPFNPVKDFFDLAADQWDKKNRLIDLFNTITVARSHYKYVSAYAVFLEKWLLQVVAGVYAETPIMLNQVLIFQGTQETGKTMWTRSLMPKEISQYCLPDKKLDVRAKGTEYRDQAEALASVVICNINEIDRLFKRGAMADFKAFLDTTEDKVRLAYGRQSVTIQRRTSFLGSTNERFFLADSTGNRRFTVIPVDAMRWNHKIDMLQLWGQVVHMYRQGRSHVLSKDTLDDKESDAIRVRDTSNMDLMTTDDMATLELMYETFDSDNKNIDHYKWYRLNQIAAILGVRLGHGRSHATQEFKAAVELYILQTKCPQPRPTARSPRAAILYCLPPVQDDAIINPFHEVMQEEEAQKIQ